MDAHTAASTFAGLFPSLYQRFHRRVDHREYQLTDQSLAVMRHLADTGPLTISEAARHMDRSQSAMSEILGRLVTRGLLARMPDERDRRRILVWLTQQGRETLKQASAVLAVDLLEQAMKGISAEQRERLILDLKDLLTTTPQRKKENS